MSPRRIFWLVSLLTLALSFTLAYFVRWTWPLLLVVSVLFALGLEDLAQAKQTIRRNFPVIGRIRYLFESIRPEIQQYFVESNLSGRPFSRDVRSLIYQRAKNVTDTIPFGTEQSVYDVGYEWMNHSLVAKHAPKEPPRVRVGGPDCKQPYDAQVLNISAMSYGSLSKQAILALSKGAKMGEFSHNTGEGGLSPYHLEGGADLVWQIGTGYFGCRDADGNFDLEAFRAKAATAQVKMIEIKLSQGAKPGHGGILPAKKVTEEISKIRLVVMGKDVISPPTHSAFSTPLEMCEFIAKLREASGGKPIGIKLCIGKRREFLAMVKAFLQTGITPDFITVDGGEGGTGAAPVEFTNVLGTPLNEGLIFVHNALVGANLRERVRVIASGRVTSGFDIAHAIAIGADMVNAARAMMFALGCIQALRCNSNDCPTGIATQDPELARGLVVSDKSVRVANYQRNTVHAFAELIAASGLEHPNQLRPWHILRRVSPTESKHYGEMYEYLAPGSLLQEPLPASFARAWNKAKADSFAAAFED